MTGNVLLRFSFRISPYGILGRDCRSGATDVPDRPQCYRPESSELLKPAITTTIETATLYKIELEMIRADGTGCSAG